jgi:hypothetical protein
MARLSEGQQAARSAELLDVIRSDYTQFASELVDPASSDDLDARQVVIEGLVERLPDPAADAVEAVITEVDASLEEEPIQAAPDGNPGGTQNDGTNPNGSLNEGGANNDGTPGKAGTRGPANDGPQPAEREPGSGATPSSTD